MLEAENLPVGVVTGIAAQLRMKAVFSGLAGHAGTSPMHLRRDALAAAGLRPFRLVSGAGHDAMVMAALAPVAMLFVRCGGGISHNPRESVTAGDVAIAIDVLEDFVRRLGTVTS